MKLRFLLVFSIVLLGMSSARAQSASYCGGIGGTVRSQDVSIPIIAQGGLTPTNGRIFAPNAALQTAPCPLIAILPGGGAEISSVEWAALGLAANGYVVVTVQPLSGGSTQSYSDAVSSAITFALSGSNPYLSATRTESIGAAGWSLGGRTLTMAQEQDSRIDAIVAWDNLAVHEGGDQGSASCNLTPAAYRLPRVPALGQASDSCVGQLPGTAKLTAFEWWRANGQPVMEVVFAGSTHLWWSAAASAEQHARSHYYTLAWFDRWLKNDVSATNRLLARTVNGIPVETLFSSAFFSGVAFDGYLCSDLRLGCQPSASPLDRLPVPMEAAKP